MMLSFFENQTRLINALKDEPDFIKEYGKDFMRAYHEEMEYAMYRSLLDDSIDINTELNRIEEKYRFNEDMNILLDATAQHLRWAMLIEYANWKRKAEESSEAENQVKGYCKQMMEEMNNEVHVHMPSEDICVKDEELEEINWSSHNISRDEAAGRGAQIRYMLGIKDDVPITAEQLTCMRDDAEKLAAQDDNIQAFLNSITDFDAAADWLSRNSYSINVAMTLLGIIKHPRGWKGL